MTFFIKTAFLFIILGCILGCEPNSEDAVDKVGIEEEKPDSAEAIRFALDLFFTEMYPKLLEPEKYIYDSVSFIVSLEGYFKNNPFGDSLIFLVEDEDWNYLKFLKDYKVKAVSDEELCLITKIAEKKSTTFREMEIKAIQFGVYRNYSDSTIFEACFNGFASYSKTDAKGNFKKWLDGRPFNSDGCFKLGDCRSLYFIKTKNQGGKMILLPQRPAKILTKPHK